MSEKVLLIHTDLLFAAKIREAAAPTSFEVKSFRDLAGFQQALLEDRKVRLLLDLNSAKLDPFEVLALAVQSEIETPLCFYSHVNEALAQRAGTFEGVRCLRKSQFVKEISSILSTWT